MLRPRNFRLRLKFCSALLDLCSDPYSVSSRLCGRDDAERRATENKTRRYGNPAAPRVQRIAPQRLSKPPAGTGGEAPRSRVVVLLAVSTGCGGASAGRSAALPAWWRPRWRPCHLAAPVPCSQAWDGSRLPTRSGSGVGLAAGLGLGVVSESEPRTGRPASTCGRARRANRCCCSCCCCRRSRRTGRRTGRPTTATRGAAPAPAASRSKPGSWCCRSRSRRRAGPAAGYWPGSSPGAISNSIRLSVPPCALHGRQEDRVHAAVGAGAHRHGRGAAADQLGQLDLVALLLLLDRGRDLLRHLVGRALGGRAELQRARRAVVGAAASNT